MAIEIDCDALPAAVVKQAEGAWKMEFKAPVG